MNPRCAVNMPVYYALHVRTKVDVIMG